MNGSMEATGILLNMDIFYTIYMIEFLNDTVDPPW